MLKQKPDEFMEALNQMLTRGNRMPGALLRVPITVDALREQYPSPPSQVAPGQGDLRLNLSAIVGRMTSECGQPLLFGFDGNGHGYVFRPNDNVRDAIQEQVNNEDGEYFDVATTTESEMAGKLLRVLNTGENNHMVSRS